MNVVIVEDEIAATENLIYLLDQIDPDIKVIKTLDAVKSSVDYFKEHNDADLILMDIQLPDMDGLEATRILKEEPALQNTPIVALTAHAMQGDREKALKAGCTGYIPKPIETKNFLKALDHFFQPDDNESECQ